MITDVSKTIMFIKAKFVKESEKWGQRSVIYEKAINVKSMNEMIRMENLVKLIIVKLWVLSTIRWTHTHDTHNRPQVHKYQLRPKCL